MLTVHARLDCTRIGHWRAAGILLGILALWVGGWVALGAAGMAQSAELPHYPEIGRLGRSSYCNPFFGFRLTLSPELKAEPLHLPIPPAGEHLLLAMKVSRLDRDATLNISAEARPQPIEALQQPAKMAARDLIQQARKDHRSTQGPGTIVAGQQYFYSVRVDQRGDGPGPENDLFFYVSQHVVRVAITSHDAKLADDLSKAVQHMQFVDPAADACQIVLPGAMASNSPAFERLYYGPALPAELVDETLKHSPGETVPPGQLANGIFADSALGLQVELPAGWKPLAADEAVGITELMRDPVTDAESWDRRRALFRACSRPLFAAINPRQELAQGVHPSMAVLAMPAGCIPDLKMPLSGENHEELNEFAELLLRSTGAKLLQSGGFRATGDKPMLHLDGTLPYTRAGEMLARRFSLRLTARMQGPWLVLVYMVTEAPAGQRELESRIHLGSSSPLSEQVPQVHATVSSRR